MKKFKKQMQEFDSFTDKLDMAAAKHLVKLGVESNWKDTYRRMRNRRKRKGKK
jgi:hypothetical protein|tara:strand:+ start:1038 stop:1196 length:159 start_codon:yes stop_codon:yes gene_type:complete